MLKIETWRHGKDISIVVDGGRITVEGDPQFAALLQGAVHLDGMQYYPDRDGALADKIRSWYGGTVIDTRIRKPLPPDAVP